MRSLTIVCRQRCKGRRQAPDLHPPDPAFGRCRSTRSPGTVAAEASGAGPGCTPRQSGGKSKGGGCGMGIALWVVQVLLAAAFLVSGATKLSQPKEKLVKNMAWVEDFSRSEEHTSELQSRQYLVCRLLLEKKHERKLLSLSI